MNAPTKRSFFPIGKLAFGLLPALLLTSCYKRTPEQPLFPARGPKEAVFWHWTTDFFEKMKKTGVFDSESIREVIHYLNEPGFELTASLSLQEGLAQRFDPNDLALALVEDKGVRSQVENKHIWLEEFGTILGLHPAGDWRTGFWLAARAAERGSIDSAGFDFANKELDGEFADKSCAVGLLIRAYSFGGKDREWAIDRLDREIANSKGPEHRFWLAAKSIAVGDLVTDAR